MSPEPSWYFTQRSAQNAADSAALAAAANGCVATGSGCQSTYGQAAAAVTARYNFTNGVNNAVVTTSSVACPDGTSPCFQVQITKTLPLHLAPVVGFNGNAALGSGRGQTVNATAVARGRSAQAYCIMAFKPAGGGEGFTINGNGTNLNTCDVYSTASTKCTGNTGHGIINSVSTVTPKNDCGAHQELIQTALADPFQSLSNGIPAKPATGSGCPASRTYSGPTNIVSVADIANTCGNFTLSNNARVTVNGTGSGTDVLYIYNGNLNLGTGARLTASEGLTIVFSGSSPGFMTGVGQVDLSAPTTGTWKGIALYKDNRVAGVTNSNYSGIFTVQGLTYARNMDFTFNGASKRSAGSLSCAAFIVNTITINGIGFDFSNPTSQCSQAGLTMPGYTLAGRPVLVR